MYGLIHRGFREFVQERLGYTVWAEIEKQRELSEDLFISTSGYPDNITIGMIATASSLTGINIEDILEEFGKFWIFYMARGEYAAMIDFYATDIISFISNINNIHDAVRSTIVGAKTPVFDVVKINEKSIIVRYVSDRSGLFAFVKGLIRGLFHKFCVEGKIVHVKSGKKFREIKIIVK